ncbi:trypsin CFT-1-like [Bicyclus anynana]|uniref:Trypsin CFT-1-like n=1 Tax=Bicyclus anynana TaxID=110368 RepID=A0ABM3LKF5_BICAN|nr:trypsin CFT-1-like [Bicyclus anynana]
MARQPHRGRTAEALRPSKALPQRRGRIVGGSPTTIEKYPFMASMQTSWWPGFYGPTCGGSLITTTTILSAAHCYDIIPSVPNWRALLGSAKASVDGFRHLISHVILHPNYVRNLWLSDVAIVRLTTPAKLSDKIKVARIAGPNYLLPDNLRVYVAGWGATYAGAQVGSDLLLHTYVHIINHALCTKRYEELRKQPGRENNAQVTPAMICTGILDVGGQDACQGDSGGPVVYQGDIIVGVTSWGEGCAHPHFPGVSARVSAYTPWIVDNALA